MADEKHKEPTHETHLGVDAWVETGETDAETEGFLSAARILAGEEPEDAPGE
ncbi:hypothetical protein ACFSYH_10805 [Populibacterium corticicola]|uniref:CopG family transcriptional regulator n=1 Tax=Populibacterium corticicola TaxID=1812826 RepID=A0ABW5XFC9_9MICO